MHTGSRLLQRSVKNDAKGKLRDGKTKTLKYIIKYFIKLTNRNFKLYLVTGLVSRVKNSMRIPTKALEP
jgi:hypothetical protein